MALLVSTLLTAVITRERVDATIDVTDCVVDPDDVIAWWKGEDNLVAEIGPDLVGTVAFDDSIIGRGMRFDGANVVGVDGLPTVDDAVSLSMWVKPADSALIQELMSRWDFPSTDDSARSFDLRLNGQSLVWSTDETSTRGPEELAVTVPQLFDGEFHHVAATWDSLTTALYVDGVPVATAPSQGGTLNAAATTSFRLGSKPGTGNPFSFTGVIDEPTVIGRALTASEVAALDRAGPNGLCTPGTTVDVVGPNLEIQDDVGAVDPVWTLDGRYLLFRTRSIDLLPVVLDPLLQTPGTDFDQSVNDRDDLVLLDTKGTTDVSDDILELVAVNSDELGGGLDSYQGAMTPTASHVAFASLSNDLVPGDTIAGGEVFIRNRLDGTTERISVRSDGSQPQYPATGLNNDSRSPSVDDSGTVVAFESTNRDLVAEANPVPGDTWETYDIYVRDISDPNPENHSTERITIGLGDTQANGSSTAPLLSSDSRYVWFSSSASNLVADDTNGQIDLFAHDRQTGTTSRVDFTGAPGSPVAIGDRVTVDELAYDHFGAPYRTDGVVYKGVTVGDRPWGAHEALPVGADPRWNFFSGSMFRGETPWTGFMNIWGQLFSTVQSKELGVRLQVRNPQLWYLGADDVWRKVKPDQSPDSKIYGRFQYPKSFQGTGWPASVAGIRSEGPGQGWSVRLGPLADVPGGPGSWHWFYTDDYGVKPRVPADMKALFVAAEMRLIHDVDQSIDLDAEVNVIASIGSDNWPTSTGAAPRASGGPELSAFVQPRMKFVTSEWNWYSGHTFAEWYDSRGVPLPAKMNEQMIRQFPPPLVGMLRE